MNVSTLGEFVGPRVRSKRLQRLRLYAELLAVDCLAIIAAFVAAHALHAGPRTFDGWQLSLMVLTGYLGIALAAEVYNATVFTNPKLSLKRSRASISRSDRHSPCCSWSVVGCSSWSMVCGVWKDRCTTNC
jgi:hypothetical protein